MSERQPYWFPALTAFLGGLVGALLGGVMGASLCEACDLEGLLWAAVGGLAGGIVGVALGAFGGWAWKRGDHARTVWITALAFVLAGSTGVWGSVFLWQKQHSDRFVPEFPPGPAIAGGLAGGLLGAIGTVTFRAGFRRRASG